MAGVAIISFSAIIARASHVAPGTAAALRLPAARPAAVGERVRPLQAAGVALVLGGVLLARPARRPA